MIIIIPFSTEGKSYISILFVSSDRLNCWILRCWEYRHLKKSIHLFRQYWSNNDQQYWSNFFLFLSFVLTAVIVIVKSLACIGDGNLEIVDS